MLTVMSGTVRVSGGLLQCNKAYMRLGIWVVKSILLRRNNFFVTSRKAPNCNLNIRKITLIRQSSLQETTQFGFFRYGSGVVLGIMDWLA